MVIAVSSTHAARVTSLLEAEGETVYTIGKLVARTEREAGCVFENLQAWE